MSSKKEERIRTVRKAWMAIGIVVFLVCTAVMVSFAWKNRKQEENVVSDLGLNVKVLEEPEDWCSVGNVLLKISSAYKLDELCINGEEIKIAKDSRYEFVATTGHLQIQATSGKTQMNATVELNRIDSVTPTLRVERNGNKITMTALDDASGVKGIYYAALEKTDRKNVPQYQLYEKELAFESGMKYFLYAEDNAGNKTEVEAKTLDTLEQIRVEKDKLSIERGEVYQIPVTAVPDGAWINQLCFESQNPEVASVDDNGTVTALNPGIAVIKVKAENVASLTVVIEVV